MKLLYFAIEGFCEEKEWKEFTLDANWVFNLENNAGKLNLSASYKDILPTNFFSLAKEVKTPTVESISAIVGANGSGKTTFARMLSEAICLSKQNHDRNQKIGYFDKIDFVAITETSEEAVGKKKKNNSKLTRQKTIKVISSREITLDFTQVFQSAPNRYLILEENPSLSSDACMVYHSPIFSEYRLIREENLVVKDISTTRLLDIDNSELESVDVTEYRIEGRARFSFEEKRRILNFLQAIVEKHKTQNVILKMPCPKTIRIHGDINASEHIKEKYTESFICDYESAELWPLLEINDLFAGPLFTFVLDSLADPALPNGTMHLANEIVRQRVRTIFSSLLHGILEANQSHNADQDMTDVNNATIRPAYSAYKKVIKDLRFLCEEIKQGGKVADNLFANDRSNEEFNIGIDMFDLIQRRISAHPDEYYAGSLNVKIDDEAIRFVGEINKLHAKCKIGWSVSYIVFSFGLSAGEMSFLTLFSRLHAHYEWLNREVGKQEWNPNQILFLDESETSLHPQLQRQLVNYMIEFFEVFIPRARVHIIFATHSPILLSDIPKGNCTFLDKDISFDQISDTFGANIFDLYRIPFNMTSGAIGAFAERKINDAIGKVASVVKKNFAAKRAGGKAAAKVPNTAERTLSIIGNPVIKSYVNDLKEGGLI